MNPLELAKSVINSVKAEVEGSKDHFHKWAEPFRLIQQEFDRGATVSMTIDLGMQVRYTAFGQERTCVIKEWGDKYTITWGPCLSTDVLPYLTLEEALRAFADLLTKGYIPISRKLRMLAKRAYALSP